MLWLFAVFSLSIDTFQAQTDHSRLVGSREGKLIVNYWSSATDPEVDQLKSLMVDAIETYLNGAVDVVEGDVTWKASIRVIKKDINKIVRDMMVLRKFKEKVPFADPTVLSFCLGSFGIKALVFSSNFNLFPDCEER